MDTTTVQHYLHENGWGAVVGEVDGIYGPRTHEAVRRFQEAWTFDELAADGIVGPFTWDALWHHNQWEGRLSDHFSTWEFAEGDTGDVRVLRGLVLALERLRDVRGEPLHIVSGFRGRDRNAAVGGASMSQHLYGAAADTRPTVPVDEVVALAVFSGIGYDADTGLVRHVDVRHLSGMNVTGGTPDAPTCWEYP